MTRSAIALVSAVALAAGIVSAKDAAEVRVEAKCEQIENGTGECDKDTEGLCEQTKACKWVEADVQAKFCCEAMNAGCLACKEDITVDEFCMKTPNLDLPGCEEMAATQAVDIAQKALDDAKKVVSPDTEQIAQLETNLEDAKEDRDTLLAQAAVKAAEKAAATTKAVEECPAVAPAGGSCSGFKPDLSCHYGHMYTGCTWTTLLCSSIMTCFCKNENWACMSAGMLQCEPEVPPGHPFGETCVPGESLPTPLPTPLSTPLPTKAVVIDECSGQDADCQNTGCCTNGQICGVTVRQDRVYQCQAEEYCTLFSINCIDLTSTLVSKETCAKGGEDCSDQLCCAEPGDKCFVWKQQPVIAKCSDTCATPDCVDVNAGAPDVVQRTADEQAAGPALIDGIAIL